MMREMGMSSIPELLTCPISLELFSEPVTLCTGQTYDRPYIEKWFSCGNFTCPVTMQKLHDLSLVPNHTLTHLIHQWLLNKGPHDFDQIYDINHVSLSLLKHVLESKDTSLCKKVQAIDQVSLLCEDLGGENDGLVQMGFLKTLLGLAFGGEITQEMMVLGEKSHEQDLFYRIVPPFPGDLMVEKSLGCVLKLMPFSCMKDLSVVLMEESKFERFKILFQDGSFMIKLRLCNLIQVIFTLQDVSLANKFANDTRLVQTLINSLHDYQQNYQLSQASIKAILGILLSSESYRENMVKEGLVQALVKYILEVEGKEKNNLGGPKATKALELVLELESAKQSLLTNDVQNGVRALIKMVFRVSGDDQGSESAVNCLMKLCSESIQVREIAICGGVLTQLLFLLQSQCCVRVKTRARLLLKLLRSMWVKDPNHV